LHHNPPPQPRIAFSLLEKIKDNDRNFKILQDGHMSCALVVTKINKYENVSKKKVLSDFNRVRPFTDFFRFLKIEKKNNVVSGF
jgi:hypothetical protein